MLSPLDIHARSEVGRGDLILGAEASQPDVKALVPKVVLIPSNALAVDIEAPLRVP